MHLVQILSLAVTGFLSCSYVSILDSGSQFAHFTVSAGQVFFVQSGSLQTIENIGDSPAELISAPRNATPIDFSLSAAFGKFTDAVLSNTYNEGTRSPQANGPPSSAPRSPNSSCRGKARLTFLPRPNSPTRTNSTWEGRTRQ